ncbi:DUF2382 domain-containing protein [Biostraticola tofi]|uniref:Uncharacterized protein DUF2382 n=1 Tax=Biostraticola tofi TaxID=466109 RepID=A0A4R3YY61_9GAMM|nr:DUF2382 domain-containing protein [Biostraticola tofi]TCV96808.1 uncharacterized protein DUF2382 [Biostraticola tofi]
MPVVNKTARIREEAGIRSEVTERVETVRDTVRRQEVEVDKDGGAQHTFDDKTPPFKK